mgnify:CR=1 FL=1
MMNDQESSYRSENPHPVDVHVGSRVRLRRKFLGMSQERLGTAIGLTFQQVQKYERGANRIGSSRLWELSKVLSVPVSYFFDEMPDTVSRGGSIVGFAESQQADFDGDPLSRKEALDLVRAFYRISDPKLRKQMVDLIKSVGDKQD